jgi:hypothetical protein
MLRWIASNQAVEAEPHARRRDAWKERAAWILATALLLAALAFATPWRRTAVPTGNVVRLSVNAPTGLHSRKRHELEPSGLQIRRSLQWQPLLMRSVQPSGRGNLRGEH